MKPLWDVAIAGAGPAGAVAALVLARSGHSVVLLDDRDYSASKVGESLPAAAKRLLATLDIQGLLDGKAHRPSYGNVSSWGSDRLQRTDFIRDPDGPGWHLDRPRFDRDLLHAAMRQGAAHRPTRVRSPARAGCVWRLGLADGEVVDARWLIDASGRNAALARGLGVRRRRDDGLVALCAWAIVPSASERTTLVESTAEGWWYTAPLPDGTRVVVFHADREPAGRTLNTPGAWEGAVVATRHVGSIVNGASWVAPPRGTEAAGARLDRFAGDGWLAVGDAALSFDPLSSKGILTSLYTGMRGGSAVCSRLRGETGAVRDYTVRLEAVRRAYLREHRSAYAAERRWPDATFWKTRVGRRSSETPPRRHRKTRAADVAAKEVVMSSPTDPDTAVGQSPKARGVTRRSLLSSALAGPSAVVLTGFGGSRAAAEQAGTGAGTGATQSPGAVSARGSGPLTQPDEIAAENGLLEAGLTIEYKESVQVGSEQLDLRMFGYPDPADPTRTKFTVPGPTFRLRRGDASRQGDAIRIGLKNDIRGAPGQGDDTTCEPPNQGNDTAPNCFRGNNYTNFHFHGFHVSPKPPGDDVFLALEPGVPTYEISLDRLRDNQAEGTHWYHPHKHGSTALQVLNGMAGAFIVEGPFDDALDALLADMTEVIFIVQDIGGDLRFPPGSTTQNYQLLVNGQLNPTVPIRPGEIQRWRFVGATMHSAAHILVTLHPLIAKQIAQDGVQFAPENYERQPLLEQADSAANQFELAPGNRADFLVQAPPDLTGTFEMFARAKADHLLPPQFRRSVLAAQAADPLFTVEISGTPRVMAFPTTAQFPRLPRFLMDIDDGEITNRRLIAFQTRGEAGKQAEFLIDGKKFDHNCVDQRMTLGTAEEWTISNDSTIQHPCHIHVNPFQIVELNGVPAPKPWVWADTIALPGAAAGTASVKIRHRFLDFEGKYVMHCHILGHEDRGMMQVLEVGDSSGLPLCS